MELTPEINMDDPILDLAIVGSGSAAFSAAIAARRSGLSVKMIEASLVGGTCVNHGCIPSKALLSAAERRSKSLKSQFPGISTSADAVNIELLMRGKIEIVSQLQSEKYVELADAHGFEIKMGVAKFVQGPAIQVGEEIIVAKHYLVATGSHSVIPDIEGLSQSGYLTSETALGIGTLPASLVVLGGNSIGLELGQMFFNLGVKVTIIESAGRLAQCEEPEISAALERIFTEDGIEVLTGAQVRSVSVSDYKKLLTVRLADGSKSEIRCDEILVATGRRPNTSELGLEELGVKLGSNGEVCVSESLETTLKGVWAAGDVTGHPQFVYVAGTHGNMMVQNAFHGAGLKVDYSSMPRVTFTSPQIASVGLSEEEAKANGYDCECRTMSLSQVSRAIVERDTRGLVKIVVDPKTDRILGFHILADGAGDLIQACIYALVGEFTADKVATTWSPYLTMAEAIKLTAQSFTRDVGELSCCAV